jgi:hypothetical protein
MRIREYEKKLLSKQSSIAEELKNGLRGKYPFLVDYEIELKLHFCVREDDLFYENDAANKYDMDIDAGLMCNMKHIDICTGEIDTPDYRGLGDDQDHSNICNLDHCNHIYRVKHCTLFHELTDHYGVPHKHLGRIGMICAEFEVVISKHGTY